MINSKFKIDFSLLLLSLLPLGLVIGPLIAEIIINSIVLIFLINSIKNKNFFIFKNKFFIFFLLFYIYLIINLFLSGFLQQSGLNIFAYIRFIFFPMAIYFILQKNDKNIKLVFIFLSLTILIVVLDGYYQFIFEKNLLGYEKYRVDRISGFFKDDLVLGSFLSRLLPLFIALILFFKNDLKLTVLNLFIFLSAFILIFLSGERAAFFTSLLTLFIINIQIKSFLYLRLIFSFILILLVSIIIFNNPTVSDRYINQTKNQIFGNLNKSNIDINKILPNYMPMFKTSFKMFEENKLLGMGPKSYRYLCDDKRFINYFPQLHLIDNTVIKIKQSWKEKRIVNLERFYIKEGDIIEKNDKIFSYRFNNDKKIQIYLSDKDGEIKKIYKKNQYQPDEVVLDIVPKNLPDKKYYYKDACNSHPHNFYIQILAEIGLIGFTFIFGIFIYLLYLLVKNLFYKYFKKKNLFSDSELCILIGLFMVLWPLNTNGNFFNNWINLISFYPLGFFFYLFNKKFQNK